MSHKARPIPFAISRTAHESLTDQLANGFRQAIANGYYSEGEILPPLKVIAENQGVSLIVARGAFRRLAEERLVLPHPGRGIEVLGGGIPVWRGRILFVVPDRSDSYHVSVVGDILRRRLLSAGYFFSQITVMRDSNGEYDMTQLNLRLKDPGLVVVEMFGVPEISRAVVAAGVKSVVVARGAVGDYPGASVARFSSAAAIADFAASCVAAGVKRVLQVGFEYGISDAASALSDAGVSVESVYVPVANPDTGVIESVKRSTLEFFVKYLARGAKLPDLVYFMDDHAAEAGFLAFALRGIAVPDGVRVVSWSNRGLAPVYAKSVARIEMDPFANGDRLAEYVLMVLGGVECVEPPVLSARYLAGETFPAARISGTHKKKTKGR